jgi:type IV pilus assembly protein PilW
VYNLGYPAIRTYSINNRKLRVTDLFDQAAGQAPIDVVDGIVDMRAQYGKDNGGGGGTANDGIVDEYNSTTPTTSADWQQVLSIRLALLARIGQYEKPASGTDCDATTTGNAPTWSGGSFSKMDFATTTSEDRCYRYRVYESNVPLRNMIWRAL